MKYFFLPLFFRFAAVIRAKSGLTLVSAVLVCVSMNAALGASAQSAPSPGPFVSAAARMIGTAEDVTPPQLVSVDFTPKSVDVSSSSQTITVTAHVTDDN